MSFVDEQMNSKRHFTASIVLPIIVAFGYLHPWILLIGTIAFFLITSFQMLKSMLFWMLILGGISTILPILAPIIFIIVIILFFARIGFILSNIRPFIGGLILYGTLAFAINRSFILYQWDGTPFLRILDIYYFDSPIINEGIPMAFLLFFILQLLTYWSYQAGHTSYITYGVMGSAPLLVIALLLPFLKFGTDFVFETAPEVVPETVPEATPGTTTNSNLVEVKGHVRTTPSGETIIIEPHVRTAPDDTITNNLSYDSSQNNSQVDSTKVNGDSFSPESNGVILSEYAKDRNRNKNNS